MLVSFAPLSILFHSDCVYIVENFSRLLPLAAKHNLRVIAYNRRDYTPSSPFNDAELAAVNGTEDAAHKAFLKDRGLEMAQFLSWIVREKKIPKASADGKAGGLALMGWSLANVFTVAFMKHLASYPKDVLETLEPYFRTFFLYGKFF